MKHLLMGSSLALLIGPMLVQQQCPPADDDDVVCCDPVWSDTMPEVGLSQKQVSSEIDLDDYLTDADNAVSDLTLAVSGGSSSTVNASVNASSHVLTLTAAATYAGQVTLQLIATDPDGHTADTTLEVAVHANRSCETVFTYDSRAYGAVGSIAVAGDFNGWSSTVNPMSNDGTGVYTASIALTTGYYQYKYVKNGSTWVMDPGNPLTAWLDGFENSEVQVPDCTQPLLTMSSVETSVRSIDALFSYTDGSNGAGLDPASIKVTYANGAPVASSAINFDSYNRAISVSLRNLEPGKYSLWVYASDNRSVAAEPLFMPIWVEDTSWNWRDATLYFAFTDRFYNGKTSNDISVNGVPYQSNYQGGDFVGIKTKIDAGYFEDLGVNAIWISPIPDNTNNAEYGVDGRLYSGYHGYWPVTATRPEPAFGTEQELKDLVAAAHEHGIRVMFDLVANHVHNQHPYYSQANINAGWFNDYSLCYENNGWEDNPIGCWFAPYLPDLNYQNTDALHAMIADAISDIKKYDIDGYRVDAVKHMENCYLYHLSTEVAHEIEHDSTAPEDQFYMVGETFVGTWDFGCDGSKSCPQALVNYYIDDRMLDGQFDFPLYWDVLEVFARNEMTMSDLSYMLDQDEDYYGDSAIMSNFIGNHDVARFISHANGDISDMWGSEAKEQGWTNPPSVPSSYVPYEKLQLAYTFLATIKGIPLIYYGDEFGMPGAGDPDNRRMMYFDSALSSYESQTLDYTRALFQLRRDHASLRSSNRVTLLGSHSDVFVYGKSAGTDKAVVAINRASTEQSVTVNVGSMGLSGTLTDALHGGSVSISGSSVTLTLPAYTAAIYF